MKPLTRIKLMRMEMEKRNYLRKVRSSLRDMKSQVYVDEMSNTWRLLGNRWERQVEQRGVLTRLMANGSVTAA